MKKSKVVVALASTAYFVGMLTLALNTAVSAEEVVSEGSKPASATSVHKIVSMSVVDSLKSETEVQFLSLEDTESVVQEVEELDFTDQLVVFDVNDYEDPVVFSDCHVTAYDNCRSCCGEYAWKYTTSTGARPTEGITVAVDPKVIPYGSIVELDGHFYIAQDCGGAIDGVELDVYIEDKGGRHTRCYEFMRELGQDYGNEIRVWMPKQ